MVVVVAIDWADGTRDVLICKTTGELLTAQETLYVLGLTGSVTNVEYHLI